MPDFKVRHTHTPYTQRVKRGLMLLNTLASGWFWRFSQKKTAVFGCLTNAVAPLPIALRELFNSSTDRPV